MLQSVNNLTAVSVILKAKSELWRRKCSKAANCWRAIAFYPRHLFGLKKLFYFAEGLLLHWYKSSKGFREMKFLLLGLLIMFGK